MATYRSPTPRQAWISSKSGKDYRITLEGSLWIRRTGAPYRDLQEKFGKWNFGYCSTAARHFSGKRAERRKR